MILEEYRIALSAQLDESALSNIQSQIKGLNVQPIKIKLDTSTVDSQIKNIQSQIKGLSNIKINIGTGGSSNGSVSFVKQETAAYKELLSIANQIDKLTLKTGSLKTAGADSSTIQSAQTQLRSLRSEYDKLYNTLQKGNLSNADFQNLGASLSTAKSQLVELESQLVSTQSKLQSNIQLKIDNGTLSGQISQIESQYNSLGIKSDEVAAHIEKLKLLMSTMDGSDDIESVVADYDKFKNTLTEATNKVRELQREQKASNSAINLSQSRTALSSEIDVWLQRNSAAAKQFGAQLQNIKMQIATADKAKLGQLKSEFQEVTRQAQIAGVATKSMTDRFKAQMGKLGTYFSASFIILRSISTVKNAISEITDLDTALVDLQKTAQATGSQLNQFYFDANETAKELGQSTKDVIQAAADWSRLGYSLEDSKKMAEVSSIFTSISPDLDMEGATEGLVSTMKAFHIEANNALDDIASKINIVGKILPKHIVICGE